MGERNWALAGSPYPLQVQLSLARPRVDETNKSSPVAQEKRAAPLSEMQCAAGVALISP